MTIMLVLIRRLVRRPRHLGLLLVDDGQFDDLDTPGFRALDDDVRAPTTDVAADVDADQDR
jgi:nitrogen fixation-related uncharacterized protein